MTEYDKKIAQTAGADETFFAGANTHKGFYNCFSDIFDEAELTALYIIKGGPGTGKSTFMKKLIAAAKEKGAVCRAYLCGSDPSSLDAVTLEKGEKHIAVIDGTSPHAYDARYPGAVSRILDCAAFLDGDKLSAERDEIIALAERKSECYACAYRYLSALSTLRSDLRALSSRALDYGKMKGACDRLAVSLAREFNCTGGETVHPARRRICNGTTMLGLCETDFAPDTRLYSVTDTELSYTYFMSALSDSLITCGVPHTRLADSTEPELLRGLYIDRLKICILPFDKKPEGAEKNINMARFVSAAKLKNTRNKRSFIRKCIASVEDGASQSLCECAQFHFRLEEIYKSAMDFGSLTAQSADWTEEILSRIA